MAWHERLTDLKQELSDVRAQRRQRIDAEDAVVDRERADLRETADSLGIAALLADMNATLLDGRGKVETIVAWELEDTEGDAQSGSMVVLNGSEESDPEDNDVITTVLSWDEGGELEIAVDLGLSEDGTYLQVNGIEVRSERDALEQSLIEAFRDELDL